MELASEKSCDGKRLEMFTSSIAIFFPYGKNTSMQKFLKDIKGWK